jgi:hypothetical protein
MIPQGLSTGATRLLGSGVTDRSEGFGVHYETGSHLASCVAALLLPATMPRPATLGLRETVS